MRINLQDSSFIVSYIQMFLKEYSGVNIKKVISHRSEGVYTDDSYIISMNNPIRVTGIYDVDTYMAAALYIAFNYPNEQFPVIWNYSTTSNVWSSTPYQQNKLIDTMDRLIKACCDAVPSANVPIDENILIESYIEGTTATIIYSELMKDQDSYLSWSELLKYFSSEGLVTPLYEYLTSKTLEYKGKVVPEKGSFTKSDLNNRLINIIVNNVTVAATKKEVAELDERILSYFFGEVVSSLSTKEEIYRVQKMMYSMVPLDRIGKFDNDMIEDIKEYQKSLIDMYTIGSSEVTLPSAYLGFKVTGYVDPWTERIIRERGVIR